MTVKIFWARSEDGYADSKDGRFEISPIFIGRTTAQGYMISDNNTRGTYGGVDFTQRDCK